MTQEHKSFSGSKDFLFDAAEQIQKEVPGAMVFICVGVPNTTTTLGWTNIPQDGDGWGLVHEMMEVFKNGNGRPS